MWLMSPHFSETFNFIKISCASRWTITCCLMFRYATVITPSKSSWKIAQEIHLSIIGILQTRGRVSPRFDLSMKLGSITITRTTTSQSRTKWFTFIQFILNFPIYITHLCTDTIGRQMSLFDIYKLLRVLLYTPIYIYQSEFY